MNAIQVLLRHSIDYAGLFPPAGLGMAPAVANYARYRSGTAAWALGRFIAPVSRLAELADVAAEHWQLAGLAGADLPGDLKQVAEFNRRMQETGAGGPTVDTLELKAGTVRAIEEAMGRIPPHLQLYFEIPNDRDPGELVAAIARLGGRAKVRTGGITPDAFPSTDNLVRFIRACVRSRVPFKATAGLHHPVRAEYPLTYAADSPRGTMFGFLNLLLATALIRSGASDADAALLLEEGFPEAFQTDETGIGWRGHRFDSEELHRTRQDGLISFGSCSFTEPINELRTLHLLEPGVPQA